MNLFLSPPIYMTALPCIWCMHGQLNAKTLSIPCNNWPPSLINHLALTSHQVLISPVVMLDRDNMGSCELWYRHDRRKSFHGHNALICAHMHADKNLMLMK